MFDDLSTFSNKLKKDTLLAKYAIYFVSGLLGMLLMAQLIAQLFTINQLNKVTGNILSKEIKVISYTSGGRMKRGAPNYDLVIKLTDNKFYNIELDEGQVINDILKTGDNITIYTPTVTYNILSLDILDYGDRVSQVELKGLVIYSFSNHKRSAWPFIKYLIMAIVLFCYVLYRWYKENPNVVKQTN